jgi:hypothetical protein
MDTWVPPDDSEWAPPTPDPLERRLAAIEARIDSLEASLGAELRAAGDELRRAVSELGRLMLRDLDRLTHVLADHRDEIVERLSTANAEPTATTPAGPDAAVASGIVGEDAPADAAPADPTVPGGRDEAGRFRVLPLPRKRRSHKRGKGGDTRVG